MFELKVVNHFAAAHQLTMVAKKCENLHGHNWKVEVFVEGEKLNDAGVVIDFGEIKRHLKDIVKNLDHTFLNELACFQNQNPSSEKIAQHIAESMQARISDRGIRVSRVRTWESEDACATYIP